MTPESRERLRDIHNELISLSQSWASGRRYNAPRARELRSQAILLNHAHYLESIPVYRRLAQDTGRTAVKDVQDIKRDLMSTDDIFKSYDPRWIDDRRFDEMNRWLSLVYHRPVEVDAGGINSIDGWTDRLSEAGIHTVYSSGTSGTFSFVPRDPEDWALARTANTCYLTSLLSRRKVRGVLSRSLMRPANALLAPDVFAGLVNRIGLRDFDGVFLGFRSGRMGNQALIRELGPVFGRRVFLYQTDLDASALHCLRRGPRCEEDRRLVERFQEETVGRREQNFERVARHLKACSGARRKVFLFGAPYQFRELCQFMSSRNERAPLDRASLILFGGGWKSFSGQAVEREALVASLSESFGLPSERVLEGYSMTEMSVAMLRCDCGRFHIPPLIEPVVFDEELRPLEGPDVTGAFGFLDPLAISHVGFIISGDQVRMVDGECRCGLSGPALTQIGRATGREVKGCGGIMGSLRA